MKRYLPFLFLLISINALGQRALVYDDMVYRPEIKSVQFNPVGKESALPVINLQSGEQVMLAFDDLRGNTRNYNYTLEHCDAQWNSSNLSPSQYLQSFTEDRLTDYRYSSATRQKYVHYELVLPNQTIAPKIAGNYLLKVYENSDQSQPIITRKLYVVGNRVSVYGEITPSPSTALRETNQKINFTIDYAGLNVQNPYNDIQTLVMQNARPQIAIMNNRPSQIRGTQLVYNDVTTNDFPGGNEFRRFDTRSLLVNSQRISHIYRDTVNTVVLLTDYTRDKPGYSFEYDNNGKFFIYTQDSHDSRTEADYAHVYFNLATSKTTRDGTPYLVGQFNNWRMDADSKLKYDGGRFYTDLFLKQGVYDYAYVWVDPSGKPDYTALEGSHFETENDYQLLVYYRPAGARWDELVGYRVLNNGLNRR